MYPMPDGNGTKIWLPIYYESYLLHDKQIAGAFCSISVTDSLILLQRFHDRCTSSAILSRGLFLAGEYAERHRDSRRLTDE
jgi:hypothetical protein